MYILSAFGLRLCIKIPPTIEINIDIYKLQLLTIDFFFSHTLHKDHCNNDHNVSLKSSKSAGRNVATSTPEILNGCIKLACVDRLVGLMYSA